MPWHLRSVSPREEHQFFNLVDLFRWFRDWTRAIPELATPEIAELEQLLEGPGAELASFIRAGTAREALAELRDRILRLGISAWRRAIELNCGSEQLLVSSFLSGEAAYTRRFKQPWPHGPGGSLAALLDDSILRLTHLQPAALVRRESPELLEVELRQWSVVLKQFPELEAPLAHWTTGYLSKFRPSRISFQPGGRLLALAPLP